MDQLQMIFVINVIIKEKQLHLLKQQKDINLEDILNYNGIVNQVRGKQINLLLYFQLIKIKNLQLEIIVVQLPVIHMKGKDLNVVGQKFI